MVLIFILIWFAFFFGGMARKREWIYHPIVWLVLGWGFCFGLYLFSGIRYYHTLSFWGGVYYWAVPVMMGIGFWCAKRIKFKTRGPRRVIFKRPERLGKQSYYLYTAGAVLGAIMCVFDILRLNTLSFSLHSELVISGIGSLGIMLSGLGLILWLYELIRAITNNQKIRLSGYVCAVCYLIPALIASGRQSILILLVSTFVVYFYGISQVGKYKYNLYILLPVLAAGVALFVYITVISSSRTEVSNKIDLFNYIYRSAMSKETEQMLDKMGIFKTFFMETLYYYSHELSMFEILFSSYDGPQFLGLSQLTLLARNISAGDGMSVFDLLWVHLDSISENAGVYSHTWRSAAANCITDFGIVGGLIFALIMGWILGRFYRNCQKSQTIYRMLGLALACAGTLFAMQFSPFCENYWLYPLIWWLLMPLLEHILTHKNNIGGDTLRNE